MRKRGTMDKNFNYDVFICYRGASWLGCELAARIDNAFDQDSLIDCFFAPKDVSHGQDFKKNIPPIMQRVKVVVLVLSKDFFRRQSDDDIVLFELENALKNADVCFLPIALPGFDYAEEDLSAFTKEETDRFKYLSAINYHGIYDDNLNTRIIPSIYNLLQKQSPLEQMQKRGGKKYVVLENESEYMSMQMQMLDGYDGEVRDPLLVGKKYILDVGSNDGDGTVRNFRREGVEQVVGIDIQSDKVDAANAKYGDERTHFFSVDVEADDFDERLNDIKRQLNVPAFDFINITMLLLHLSNPYNLLKNLRKHISKDGYLFIRDIDDDFNFFYPDKNGIFRRYQNMVTFLDTWGYRKSGKEIYTQLKLAGFRRVQVAQIGLNTSEMDYDEKETLFNVYFGGMPHDADLTVKNHPDNALLRGEARWARENIEEANKLFHMDEFIFSLGYILYVAQK